MEGRAMAATGTSAGDRTVFDIRFVKSKEDTSLDPLIIVSVDSHVALPTEGYAEYLDPKYRDHYFEDMKNVFEFVQAMGDYPFSPEVIEKIDDRYAMRTGGEIGYFDPERRLRETEAEGVVAEFLHPVGMHSSGPFFDLCSDLCSPELRAVGARAHNRFLEDFCSVAPGRFLGVPEIYPWPDAEAAARECERVRAAGMHAVFPAQQAGIPGDPCPAFFDPFWDPFWAACQDLGLVIHIHAGWGIPQAKGGLMKHYEEALAGNSGRDFFDTFVERRPLWQLMFGGVFDRFPGLRVSFVEIHCDWVPATLAYLDRRHAEGASTMKLKPSEYWERHCAIGGSLMRHSDVAVRHEVGLNKFMFGTDYPHPESSWPNTHDAIRTTLGGVPEFEARRILGINAIEFYGLDRELLAKEARRCGPVAAQVLGQHHVDEAILKSFEDRAGIGKSPRIHAERLADAVDEDLAAIAKLQR
jgi:predicted TIM-barrel fold metal-dependent hydrolase